MLERGDVEGKKGTCNLSILFVADGAGGSEVIKAIVNCGIKDDIEVMSCSQHSSEILGLSITPKMRALGRALSGDYRLVVSERSNSIKFHSELTKRCIENSIKNLVLTDYCTGCVEHYKGILPDIPTAVTAVTKESKDLLVKRGVDESNIYMLGNPAYDGVKGIEYKRGYSKEPRVLYVSQGGQGNINSLENMSEFNKLYLELFKIFDKFTLDVKLHPMEESERCNWDNVSKFFSNVNILPKCLGEVFVKENISNYDIITGRNSTLQVKSKMIGIPTIMLKDENLRLRLIEYKCNNFINIKQPCEDIIVLDDLSLFVNDMLNKIINGGSQLDKDSRRYMH